MTNFRSEDERDDLNRAAREMREAGMAMHEIAHELAVPVSTLFRWAAEGGWRGKDIAAARLRAVFAPSLSSRAEDGQRPAADPGSRGGDAEDRGGPTRDPGSPPCGVRDDTEEETNSPPPITPLEARAAGERAFKGAMALMEAGELKSAGEAMRLAERMLLAARLLAGLPIPEEHDAAAMAETEENLNEIARRVHNMVHAALQGKVSSLPGWATTKEFLADTLYPDMYYRDGGVGTGIAGHYGPGPADDLERDAPDGFGGGEGEEPSGR